MNLFETTQLASKYEGVSWNEKRNLWQAEFHINGKKQKSYFNNEFDATKKLKKLCETMEIPSQNPTISTIPNQQVIHIPVYIFKLRPLWLWDFGVFLIS